MEKMLNSLQDCRVGAALPAQAPKAVTCFRASLPTRRCRAQASAQATPSVIAAAAVADLPNVGPDPWNKTYYPKGAHADNSKKPWFIIDAEGQTLGRLATLAAVIIRGKNRPEYSPSMDMGGFVIVINAEKVQVGGAKDQQKLYYRHSGRPGSLKSETFAELQARIPERIVEKSVKGMLPKGRLGRQLFNHLKVFKGPKHPHQAQRATDVTNIINVKPEQLAAFLQQKAS